MVLIANNENKQRWQIMQTIERKSAHRYVSQVGANNDRNYLYEIQKQKGVKGGRRKAT